MTLEIQEPIIENRNIWYQKLPNGSIKGLIGEIISNDVDTSIAGFIRDIDRQKVVDFSPDIFKSMRTLVIRKPSKHDFSLKYFVLEFTMEAWLLILWGYLLITLVFFLLIMAVITYNIDKCLKNKGTLKNMWEFSLSVCLKSFLSKVSTSLNVQCVP